MYVEVRCGHQVPSLHTCVDTYQHKTASNFEGKKKPKKWQMWSSWRCSDWMVAVVNVAIQWQLLLVDWCNWIIQNNIVDPNILWSLISVTIWSLRVICVVGPQCCIVWYHSVNATCVDALSEVCEVNWEGSPFLRHYWKSPLFQVFLGLWNLHNCQRHQTNVIYFEKKKTLNS